MPHTTLNLAQLARYLHIPEPQVRKLVERGSIPGRRVNGEWTFSREEVHRWLEHRIGVSDEKELVRVEEALDRTVPPGSDEEVRLATLIPEGAIAIPLDARTRDSVIRSMIRLAEGTGLLWDAKAMAEAVKEREELHSTALDNGVALLHSRRPLQNILGDTFIVLGISPNGIPFGGGFDNLTDIFFLICSMDDRVHLRILTRLSRMLLTVPNFVSDLRNCENEHAVRTLIARTEAEL